jgi:hypothetical protein
VIALQVPAPGRTNTSAMEGKRLNPSVDCMILNAVREPLRNRLRSLAQQEGDEPEGDPAVFSVSRQNPPFCSRARERWIMGARLPRESLSRLCFPAPS